MGQSGRAPAWGTCLTTPDRAPSAVGARPPMARNMAALRLMVMRLRISHRGLHPAAASVREVNHSSFLIPDVDLKI